MDSRAVRRRYESPLREEQHLATRNRILAALADVLTEDGNATVPAVADRAGVSERTVYRHFPTREALFSGLFAWATQQARDPSPSSVEELTAAVREMFPRYELRPEVIRAMNSQELGQELRRLRAAARRESVRTALASALEGMEETERRQVEAVVHLLASSTGYLHLHDFWDMTADDAAEAVEWAVRALVRAAQDRGRDDRARVGRARTRKLGG